MTDVSFLPEDYKEKRIQRRTNIISLGLFVVVMIAIIGAYFVTNKQRDDVREQLIQVNEDFAEAARRLEQLEQLRWRKRQIIRKANLSSVLLERVPRSLVLSELINRMPEDVALTELRLATETVRAPRLVRSALEQAKAGRDDQPTSDLPPLPQIKPTVVTLLLTGLATTDVDVAQYMARLGRSEMFADLNLIFSQEVVIDGAQLRKFSVEMSLNQQVNVEHIQPLRVRRGENADTLLDALTTPRLSSFPNDATAD
jgi:Tfp pilus assembly protein PilN